MPSVPSVVKNLRLSRSGKKIIFIYDRRMGFAVEEIAEVQNIVELVLKDHSHKFFPVFQRDDRELLDRMVRVEEELKHLREDMQHSREDSNRRFAEMLANTTKQFERVDKRFEEAQANTDRRFVEMFKYTDKRFEEMQANMNLRFSEMQASMNLRFEEAREDSNKRFSGLKWNVNLVFIVVAALISMYQFLK